MRGLWLELYILEWETNKVIPVPEYAIPETRFIEWATWMHHNRDRCRVGYDTVGQYEVSTVFIGSWGNIFETMVFDSLSTRHALDQQRAATWDEAVANHTRLVNQYRVMVSG